MTRQRRDRDVGADRTSGPTSGAASSRSTATGCRCPTAPRPTRCARAARRSSTARGSPSSPAPTCGSRSRASNPTGSFKDRGMTVALSVAVGQGAEAVVCASTGNTSASMAAYAARAKVKPLVLVPQGKIAAGKLAQAIVHGAQVIMVRGNFDDCLRMSRELAEQYPVALVNSVNPFRLEGQKTAPFEIVDFLGDAPDVHVLPVGNAGNISAYWKGYVEYAEAGHEQRAVRGCSAGRPRAPRRWCSASRCRARRPSPRPSGSATPRRGTSRSTPPSTPAAGSASVSDEEILIAQRQLAAAEGIFVEPGSAASVAGLLKDVRGRRRLPRPTMVVTVTGHGLKDIDTALSTFTDLVDTVVEADVGRGRRRRRPARERAAATRCAARRRAGAGPGAGEQRQPRARVRRARAGARAPRRRHGRGQLGPTRPAPRASSSATGEGADDRAAGRDAPRLPRHGARVRGDGRAACPACACTASTRSRTAGGSARPRPRSSPGWPRARALVVDGPTGCRRRRAVRRSPPRSRATPTTSRPAVFGGFTIAYGDAGRLRARSGSTSTRRWRSWCSCPTTALRDQGGPRAAARRGAARGRRRNAGRAALLVAALTGRPDQLLARPRTGCTSSYRAAAMPASAGAGRGAARGRAPRRRLRRRADGAGAGRPPDAVAEVRRDARPPAGARRARRRPRRRPGAA